MASTFPGVTRQLHIIRYRNWERKIAGVSGRARPLRPDFIIIGAPKCGTSWLSAALNQHPNILTVPNEIEYFSSNYHYPAEWYFEHFVRELATKSKPVSCVLGEKSAHYCSIAPNRIRQVRDLLPDVRLILMARDPVSRHWAHAKRFFSKNRLRNPEEAVLTLPRSKLFEFFRRERPVGEFSKIIAEWTRVFSGGQLLVVSQERTLASPQVTYDGVLEHIGASTNYDPTLISFLSRQTNRGPKIEMPEDVAEFLDDMFTDERRWLRDFFGNRSFVSISNTL